jgi:ArsC family
MTRHYLAQSELLDLAQGAGAHSGGRHRTQVPPPTFPASGGGRRGLGLGDETLSDAALIEAMHAHPIPIERPVVQSPKGTRLCRPPERVQDIL